MADPILGQSSDQANKDFLAILNRKAPPEPAAAPTGSRLMDVPLGLLKGAIGLPEAAVGLADIATGGYAGKAAETLGFQPKQAKEIINSWQSPQLQQARKDVQETEGFFPTLGAMVQHPSTIIDSAAESAPSMLGGAGVARGLMRALPKLSATVAAGIGEGAMSAGSTAEQIRQETPDGLLTPKQMIIPAVSGAVTAGLGVLGGKIANKLGIADVDTMLASGTLNPKQGGVIKSVLEGALSEGVLEELPQSAQEQVAQNVALGKPWNERVAEAAASGMIVGGMMGGGGNVISSLGSSLGKNETTPAPVAPEAEQPAAIDPAPIDPATIAQEAKAQGAGALEAALATVAGPKVIGLLDAIPDATTATTAGTAPTASMYSDFGKMQTQFPSTQQEVVNANPVQEVQRGQTEVATSVPVPATTADASATATVPPTPLPEVSTSAPSGVFAATYTVRRLDKQTGEFIESQIKATDEVEARKIAAELVRSEGNRAFDISLTPQPTVEAATPTLAPKKLTYPTLQKQAKALGVTISPKTKDGYTVGKKILSTLEAVKIHLDELAAKPVKPPKMKTPAPKLSIDPKTDDILVAIHKLGGIDFAQATSQWGKMASDDRKAMNRYVGTKLPGSQNFGHVFKNGGLKLDDIRNQLVGWGYLKEDAEITDLEAAMYAAAAGKPSKAVEHEPDYDAMQAEQYADEIAEYERMMSDEEQKTTDDFSDTMEEEDLPPEVLAFLNFESTEVQNENNDQPEANQVTGAAPTGATETDSKSSQGEVSTEAVKSETTDDAGGLKQTVAVEGDKKPPVIGGVQKQGGSAATTSDLLDNFAPLDTQADLFSQPAPAAAPTPAPSSNTVFTDDAAAAARALLRERLNRPHTGLDPEMVNAGITLAGYHIEKGARTFAAYVKAMVEDLGEAVRPYLKAWYMAIKYHPSATGFEGMDTAAIVEAHDVTQETNNDLSAVPEEASQPETLPPVRGADETLIPLDQLPAELKVTAKILDADGNIYEAQVSAQDALREQDKDVKEAETLLDCVKG